MSNRYDKLTSFNQTVSIADTGRKAELWLLKSAVPTSALTFTTYTAAELGSRHS